MSSDSQSAEFALYPNPADDVLNLSIETEKAESINVSVFDMQGRIIRNEVLVSTPGVNVFTLDTSTLVAGFYLIQVSKNDHVNTQRFIVAR